MGMTRTQLALEELKAKDINSYEALKHLWVDSFKGEFNHKDVEEFVEKYKLLEHDDMETKHIIESIIKSIHGVVGVQ